MQTKIGFIIALVVLTFGNLRAQSLEDILAQDAKPETYLTKATFKSTRIINGHSIESMAAQHLDFRISHRFGALNSGAYNFWGLDMATIRLGLEYGLTDNFMVGIGRNSFQKTFDGFIKYRLLRQSTGGKSFPFTLSLFGSSAVNTLERKFANPDYNLNFTNRLTHVFQVLIARKFSEYLSLQITPTYIHRNLVPRKTDDNGVGAIGFGGRIKLTRRTSFNAEYFYQLPGNNADRNTNCLSTGFDIETGGHVFQLHITNSRSMIEKGFIAENQGKWSKGDIFYGFNISRTFSLEKKN
jgi:hypothetical protein